MKTKKNPLVTIIITNFNKSKYLVKAIKSCVNQKYQKIEIIFFDDKSTDNSLKRLKDFKFKNKVNLKIITNNKNGKIAVKKLNAMALALVVTAPFTIPKIYNSKRSYIDKPSKPGNLICLKKRTNKLTKGILSNLSSICLVMQRF